MAQALTNTLFTHRLRIEPVTPALAAAARAGAAAFAEEVGVDAPDAWCASSLGLIGRSAPHAWGPAPSPTRAIVILEREHAVIGDVRFEPSLRAAREYELGYSIARPWRRRGFAVEASAAILDWLFDEGVAETVIAGCDSSNVASVRTLRRLGFWLDSTPGRTFWWVISPELRATNRA